MFGKILAPLNGSPLADRVLLHVAAIAPPNGPPITLLRILETDGVESTAVDPLAWHFAKAEAQAHLDEAANQLSQLGLVSNTVLLEGDVTQRIVEYAHQHSADLLVLSSDDQDDASGWNVSSIAQKVTHHTGTSVLLVRSADANGAEGADVGAGRIRYHHILAPLDGSQRAESALPLAAALAKRHAAELLVVHVAIRPEMIQRVPLSPEDSALAERVVARNTLEAGNYFAQLKSRLPPEAQTRILTGDSVSRILHDLVAQDQVDLVVLSAHGHACHSQWPYSPLVNSFITYGATSLLILQDYPTTEARRALVEHPAEDLTMPTRRANGEEGLTVHAHFEI